MRSQTVTVMGGGVAGLATALHLARDGHRVTILERDSLDVGNARTSPTWARRGIPHFLQPHAFIPRGRTELRAHLPDIYDALLGAGAGDVDLRRKLPGPIEPEDEVLQYIGVRRPLIEWALRQAVAGESGIEVRDGVRATGLDTEADLTVDAMGR